MNPVLENLLRQREEQFAFVDTLLANVAERGGDMVDAEESNLTAARDRISKLDSQIKPLQDFEATRTASAASTAAAFAGVRPTGGVTTQPRALGATSKHEYRSAGEWIADKCRASGHALGRDGYPMAPDPSAAMRLAAVEKQVTSDTPGILPTPTVGPVVNLIDASRPLVTAVGGARSMGNIPGAQFYRPKVTQHTVSGKQTGEKEELPSRKLKIEPLTFAKETHGGVLNVSRQTIDWTSPEAWNIIVNDLGDSYAVDTEQTVVAAFAAGITQSVTPTAATQEARVKALYQAAVAVYKGCKKLPDRIFCSLDMWAELGALVDIARLVFPPNSTGLAGSSDLRKFAGVILDCPRIVVPDLPDGHLSVGVSSMFEVYEEIIGLLSAVEPGILGVEVAYGGYIAAGFIEPKGFCKVQMASPITATGATAGTPGLFTPEGAALPANLAAMTGVTAAPTAKWAEGQYVSMGDTNPAYWDGSKWVAGNAPAAASK